MSLLLTVYESPDWNRLIDVYDLPVAEHTELSSVGGKTKALKPAQKLSSIAKILSTNSAENHLWLGVVQAEYFLSKAVEDGSSIAEASEQWQKITQDLLALKRENRQRINLFNLNQALAHPYEFNSTLGLKKTVTHRTIASKKIEFSLLAACQYVSQKEEIKELNSVLHAYTISFNSDEAPILDIEKAIQQNNKITKKLSETENERNAILLQLQHAQEEIEDNYKSLAVAQETIDQLITQNEIDTERLKAETQAVHTREVKKLEAKFLEQTYDLEKKLSELHVSLEKAEHSMLAHEKQYNKELSKQENFLRKMKAQAAYAEYNCNLLQQEITDLRNSTAWKSTAPVRALGRLVKNPKTSNIKLLQDAALLLTSEYFDVEWYLKNYADVSESKINPAEHYLLFGASEGRLPGPLFDGNWYLQQYPDVADTKTNPLLHFIMFGQAEGRRSSPVLLTNDIQNNVEQ
ncbi:hypothetical protein [Cellvibrio polysaccharolyticus]|uniref:Uncharacterized protein n=1 Tax=Cellvibrio polysaccharolyticus TaxID=2082724 RepID=A0A928YVA7_9GAMM|nr:hypothetical protein [Cellvibrio polysaccharolyticus]MBE8718350.1 hypothetical protein [Cellvibrio polysaccharolyticus]